MGSRMLMNDEWFSKNVESCCEKYCVGSSTVKNCFKDDEYIVRLLILF